MYEKAFFKENENKEKNGEIQEHKHVTREFQTLHICKLHILHIWVGTASAIYHFLCCIDLISKMLLSTSVIFVVIFRGNTMSRFGKAVSGSPRQ